MLTRGSVSFITTLSLAGSEGCKEGVCLKWRSISSIFGWRW